MIILIHCMHGLGNKVFDLIIGMYIQKINGGEIYFVNNNNPHELKLSPKIDEMFPNLKKKVKFIRERDMNDIKNKYKNKLFIAKETNINNLDDLNFKNKYEVVYFFNNFYLYKYIYNFYSILANEIIDNFKINIELINKEILDISKTKYAAIHIRYGDKLDISHKEENKYKYNYLVYHPRFYIKMIQTFLKNNINVYIVSDDENIVRKFILDKIKIDHNNKLKILSIPLVQALYVLCHAKYLVMSMSTLSMVSAFINKKLKRAFIVSRPKDIEKYSTNEEYLVEKTNWKIYTKKKYILNYDQKLIKNMLESRLK